MSTRPSSHTESRSISDSGRNQPSFFRTYVDKYFYLSIIVLLGIATRWPIYLQRQREPLDPDAAGFLEIIQSGSSWYETAASTGPWAREPFWIWINRIAAWGLGANENTLRLVSLIAGIFVIFQTARLGRLWFGSWVGNFAALGIALSPRWIEWSVRGLRTEFYTFLILCFFSIWERFAQARQNQSFQDQSTVPSFEPRLRPVFRSTFWSSPVSASFSLGLLAAVAHLTYISSFTWTVPLTLWRAWRDRWKWPWVTMFFLIAFIPLLPHLAFNARYSLSRGEPRDFFFSSNIHARFYKNYERYGQTGSPNRDLFYQDPYGGPPITTARYLFGEHSILQLISGSLRGAWKLYIYRAAGIEQFEALKILLALYIVGALSALLTPSGRASLIIWFWLGLPFLYIASLRGFDTRLAAPLTPWMWFYLALGLIRLPTILRAVLERPRQKNLPILGDEILNDGFQEKKAPRRS